ncbi:PepSY-associated TM helix domain-containing protein [Foetidibacter luteolus]|uniref:PepSY-associated TM helix domain-containing protein n=1 Tax=Foetidibacter luteolus TaxID=2608880 RepID=UPI00129AB8CF|nr:PepSY-associated TM helix domain-containing protein [Foetidibacter luteolus]
MSKKYTVRKFVNDVHLWLGLASGLVLFVVCLSGTIYTFRAEIERWMSPEKYYVQVEPNAVVLPADSLVAIMEKQLGGKVTGLQVPADAAMAWQISVKPKDKEAGRQQAGKDAGSPRKAAKQGGEKRGGETEVRPKTYFVNPYTGALTPGQNDKGVSEFFTTVMQLHRWLLLDTDTGRVVVGIATLIFVFIIVSGLVLWFPAKMKNLKQGFKIKFKANWKRVNHDLHNALGFYASIFVLIMALTGLCWSFEWYKDGASSVLGAKVFKGRSEKPLQSKLPADSTVAPASLAAITATTDQNFTYSGDTRITLPADKAGAVVVTRNKTGFFASAGADKLQLDRYTAAVLKLERFADKPLNVKIADSIKPLHTGEMFGAFSKIIYFLACLIATSLPVTGTLIWINKMKKKPKNKVGRVTQQEAQPAVSV